MVLLETNEAFESNMSDQIQNIPTVHFYGEEQNWRMPDHFHVEALSERSSLHDWKINPHRHRDFGQFFFLESGTADVWLDGTQQTINAGSIVYVPALSVHGFVWSVGAEGKVVSVSASYISQLAQEISGLQEHLTSPLICQVEEGDMFMAFITDALLQEYAANDVARPVMLEAFIRSMIIGILRKIPRQNMEHKPKDRRHAYYIAFAELLEKHYKEHQPVTFYADALGITPTYLSRICQDIGGAAAKQTLHERLMLEAKRNLIYTGRSIAEIAYSLGFEDPSYFARFFQRHRGLTPKAYRDLQNGQ